MVWDNAHKMQPGKWYDDEGIIKKNHKWFTHMNSFLKSECSTVQAGGLTGPTLVSMPILFHSWGPS